MIDERAKKLAGLVLDYSLELKKGDRLFLQYDPAFSYYGELFVEEAIKRRAEVREDVLSFDPTYKRGLLERFSPAEFQRELERRNELARWCNTRVHICCDSNPDFAKGLEKQLAEFNREIIGPYKEVLYRPADKEELKRNGEKFRTEFVRWNIVGFPSEQDAKNAGMNLRDYQEFVYSATLGSGKVSPARYWRNMQRKMEKVKEVFDAGKEVHIYIPGNTDLNLNLEERKGEICSGLCNMPDGEVFYCPIENSAEGYIHFQHLSVRDAGRMKGIKLKFEKGKVVDFSAKENQKALEGELSTDEGARRIGELGIGCNYGVKFPIGEVLFDEKIGGTIHLALGDSISEDLSNGGGLNKSDIHWDIVCDLRRDEKNLKDFPGGIIEIDGKVVQENGKWKI